MLVPKFSYYAEIQQQFVAFLLVRSLIMQPPHFLYLAETRTSSRKHQKPSNDRGRDSHNRWWRPGSGGKIFNPAGL